MKKEHKTIIILILIVIAVILIINFIKGNGNHDEEVMECIAKNSKVVVSPTCGACARQKEILGNYLDKFELINFNQELGERYKITAVPTWIINEQIYKGVKTIEELKELTGCSLEE